MEPLALGRRALGLCVWICFQGLAPVGPKGDQGERGEQGPPGQDGTVDTSQFYTKKQTYAMSAFKQDNLVNTPGSGTVLFNSGMLRRLVASSGVTITLDSDDNLVIGSTGGCSGGTPPR